MGLQSLLFQYLLSESKTGIGVDILVIFEVELPMAGVYEEAFFMTIDGHSYERFPSEIHFSTIRIIRSIWLPDRGPGRTGSPASGEGD